MCIAQGKPGWGGVYTEYVRAKCEYVGEDHAENIARCNLDPATDTH